MLLHVMSGEENLQMPQRYKISLPCLSGVQWTSTFVFLVCIYRRTLYSFIMKTDKFSNSKKVSCLQGFMTVSGCKQSLAVAYGGLEVKCIITSTIFSHQVHTCVIFFLFTSKWCGQCSAIVSTSMFSIFSMRSVCPLKSTFTHS